MIENHHLISDSAGWADDCTSNNPKITVNINRIKNCKANFISDVKEIMDDIDDNGSIRLGIKLAYPIL